MLVPATVSRLSYIYICASCTHTLHRRPHRERARGRAAAAAVAAGAVGCRRRMRHRRRTACNVHARAADQLERHSGKAHWRGGGTEGHVLNGWENKGDFCAAT
eukprot:IDg16129t1